MSILQRIVWNLQCTGYFSALYICALGKRLKPSQPTSIEA